MDEAMQKAAQAELTRYIEQQLKWMNHPSQRLYREQLEKEWRARPWWVRARIRASGLIERGRMRLGEIIAGHRFDEY